MTRADPTTNLSPACVEPEARQRIRQALAEAGRQPYGLSFVLLKLAVMGLSEHSQRWPVGVTLNRPLRDSDHDHQSLLNGLNHPVGHLRGGVPVVGADRAPAEVAAAAARLAKVGEESVADILGMACNEQRAHVMAQFIAERQIRERDSGLHPSSVAEACIPKFEEAWSDSHRRLAMCAPKDLIHTLNSELPKVGGKAVSPRTLSLHLQEQEIPPEMRYLLLELNGYLSESVWGQYND
jgi:hypothetical protein